MSWPETPCDHCPIGAACKAMRLRVERYCQLVDPAGPDYNPAYIARLGGAPPPVAVAPEGPGLLGMAKSAVVSAVQHVAAGMPKAPPEVKAERLAICRECPYYLAESGRCRACGCFLDIKAGWAGERCPLMPPKWDSIPTEKLESSS